MEQGYKIVSITLHFCPKVNPLDLFNTNAMQRRTG